MSETRSSAANGGIGLSGALFILFLALQLTGNIDWPWYAVAAPLWVPVALVLAVIGAVFLVCLPSEIRARRNAKRIKAERAKGKPATTETFDRIGKEFADEVVKASNEKRSHPMFKVIK